MRRPPLQCRDVSANRRTATRHDVSLPGQLALDGQLRDVLVQNLSLGGALIAAGARIAMGQRVQFTFRVPTAEELIDTSAIVRWSDDKATGLQFEGLRARDVWALNKFFEQLPASP